MQKISMPKHNADPAVLKSVLNLFYINKNKWLDNRYLIENLKLQSDIGMGHESQSYTKMVQIPAYFRFVEWENPNNRRSRKKITERGIRFYKALVKKNEKKIYEELINSLTEIHFGVNVHGTPSCNSNIEPPKIFIFFAMEIGYLTISEFAYVLENIDEKADNVKKIKKVILAHRDNTNNLISDIRSQYLDAKPIKALINWGFLKRIDQTRPFKIQINNKILKKYKRQLLIITNKYTKNESVLTEFIEPFLETETESVERKKSSITGDKAEIFFKENAYTEFGFNVTDETDKTGLGYDFICQEKEYYIEIKGCLNGVDSIRLTEKEWELAKEKKEKYKLIIVYDLDQIGQEKMKMISNPYKHFNQFIETKIVAVKSLHLKGKYLKKHD